VSLDVQRIDAVCGRAAVVARLRQLLPRREERGCARVLPFGLAAVDGQLPQGGLALDAVHELTSADEADMPAAFGFMAALLGHAAAAGRAETPALLVLSRRSLDAFGRPYAHGLKELGLQPGRLLVCNRDPAKAAGLAARFRGEPVPFERLGDQLVAADIVLTSTGSTEPVITRATVEGLLRRRRCRPVFLIDIAVPRDVEASAGELDHVYLYNLDDLQQVVQGTLSQRKGAIEYRTRNEDGKIETQRIALPDDARQAAASERSLPVHPSQLYSTFSALLIAAICVCYFSLKPAPGRVMVGFLSM
jgi:hypothetical protein